MEALEDFEDILRLGKLPRWKKDDFRLKKLRYVFEGYPSLPSNSSSSSSPSAKKVLEVLGGLEGKEGLEVIVNYLIDLLIRGGYLLDRQINAVENKHEREGGYREKLFRKRLAYKRESY